MKMKKNGFTNPIPKQNKEELFYQSFPGPRMKKNWFTRPYLKEK